MADRDETITRLKFLTSYIHSPEGVTMNGINKAMLVLEIAARDAVELLKEQEAVEPVRTPETVRDEYNCGKCTAKVGVRVRGGGWYFKAWYCPDCGRRVKWDEA